MSVARSGDVYWLVASSTAEQGREGLYSVLRSRVQKHSLVTDTAVFDIPLNLKFGTFNDLIRMADELIKHDNTCEQILRRVEREALEIDPAAELRIIFQRNTMTLEQYLHRFTWDEAKYPKARHMRDNIEFLLSSVCRIDDEIRIKSLAYRETKQSQQSAAKQDSGSFVQKDLTDVLTPDIVQETDFINTEHLITVVAVVPTGLSDTWMNSYESFDPFVVPRSTRKFAVADKDGNSLWRVVVFKSSLESFRNVAKSKRFIVREFIYSPTALQEKLTQRSRIDAEKNKQESFMTRVCLTSFSDVCIAWIHIKAMRLFVEAVLRYGVPPNFATFLLKPNMSKEKKLRKELNDIFTTDGMFGRAFIQNNDHSSTTDGGTTGDIGGDDSYYPYVFMSFVPFLLFTQK